MNTHCFHGGWNLRAYFATSWSLLRTNTPLKKKGSFISFTSSKLQGPKMILRLIFEIFFQEYSFSNNHGSKETKWKISLVSKMVIFYFHDCGRKSNMILLMEEILHQFTLRLYHYLQGFIHPRWLFGISEPSTV